MEDLIYDVTLRRLTGHIIKLRDAGGDCGPAPIVLVLIQDDKTETESVILCGRRQRNRSSCIQQ
jgi:hypothetical protein